MRVRFYPAEGAAAEFETVNLTLDYGRSQAALSGDVENGAYEVWPQVFEKAYAEFAGWANFVDGGFPEHVWLHLTGTVARVEDPQDATAFPTDTSVEILVREALIENRIVWFSTITGGPWPTGPGPTTLRGSHCYLVTGIDSTGTRVELFNPWGEQHPHILFADIRDYIGLITISGNTTGNSP